LSTDLWNWLTRSPKSRELQTTHELLAQVNSLQGSSPLATDDQTADFLLDLIDDICERNTVSATIQLGEALWEAIQHLLYLDGFRFSPPEDINLSSLTLEEGVELRATLNRHLRFLTDHERLLPIWREKVAILFSGILDYFPLSAFTDTDERGEISEDAIIFPEAHAYDLCDNLPEALDRTIVTFFDADITQIRLFETIRKRLDENVLFASGIPKEKRQGVTAERVKLPSQQTHKTHEFLLETYFQSTPFVSFFSSPLPFAIPFPARFEHTHIVGGTGHGKTQLMQFLIHHDLVRALEDERSVVIMDSQGDLIRTISRLGLFSPSAEQNLADRLVLIDPTDVEHPVCLNMFDFNRDRMSGYAPVDREKILNATVELYEYFFGALLGAELTQRQGLIFRYLARLMLEIPEATIHTLRELMENGERFRPYMERLQGTARSFFETRFFDRQFNETKKQILTRLWGVLSNTSLERMFSHARNKIDIFDLLNQGKIILINTAKDLLGQEGTAIFGRFFISLIAQAAIQRSVLPPHERRPSFVYIDEAQDYFDENISHLLNQARKYRVGLVFAHQNLDQLGAGLRSSVLASTTIKFAGGLSARDAQVLDSEMRCESGFLLAQKKERTYTEFACYVKNYTSRALSVRIPFGYVESLPELSHEEHQNLIERNRLQYSAPPMLPKPAQPAPPPEQPRSPVPREAVPAYKSPVPEVKVSVPKVQSEPKQAPSPEPVRESGPSVTKSAPPSRPKDKPVAKKDKSPGHGGRNHRYYQQLIKQLAERHGFRCSVEESILEGAGRIDVVIAHGDFKAAFEISVTTDHDQELSNIEKCIAAGYTSIALVGHTERHIKKLSRFIEASLDEKYRDMVQYLSSDSLPDYFDSLAAIQQEPRNIRGYKVRVAKRTVTSGEADARRQAIAEVIARSIAKGDKDS
jgi:hypothetical protein